MAKGGSKMFMMGLFMFMLNFHSSQGEEEVHLLLSFKASIHDPLHFLSNWVATSPATPCNWHGITCDNSSHVSAVVLTGKNFTGEVSSSIFRLPHVTKMDLSNNQFVGGISLNNSLRYSLRYLNLSNNNLTVPLPDSLFSSRFSNLETLDLSNNMFSGKIPENIGLLSRLRYLDLGGNVLVGQIPNSVTNLTNLQYLTLASNQLVGEIPSEIGIMKSLKWIYLGYNNLSGEIPNSIGELLSLNHLDLVYNNLTGQIPLSIGNLTNLQYLFLYQNKLTGPIPQTVYQLRKLISLDLSDNFLSGEISERVGQLQNLEILHLFSNSFTGKIPEAVTSLPRLQVLQLWSNKLTGEIPKDLGKRGNLTVLDLSTNTLTGKIPDSLCGSGNLFKLILFSNSFEGEIPNGISSCRSLRRVRLQNNKLSGELPLELTTLRQVYFMDISGNQLSGRIDDRNWNMPELQMLSLANNNLSGKIPNSFGSDKLEHMDLSGNQFSGYIPLAFGNLTELVQLKLSHNKLFGEIPEEICSCKKLVVLDLSDNRLTGEIPVKLAEMPVLGMLDLSENDFSGEIPKNLGSVESLVQVNVSHNHFHGGLPSTGAFLAINASAVTGNDLCDRDGDSPSGLPPCKREWRWNLNRMFILLCFLVAMVAFAGASSLVFYVRRKKSLELRRVENEDGAWELKFFDAKAWKLITIDDVLSSAKEGKVIFKGRNCVSYEGKCMNSDMQFVVNEISDLNSLPLSFWEETVKFGKMSHPNIMKLLGTCRSGKRGYLVFEYEEGKKLTQILNSLNWQRRRKITVGVAKALKFLHCHNLTGDFSPETVTVVDGKDLPRLKIFLDANSFISSSYVTQDGREKSEEIYGFGVMLIELLTGRSGVDAEAGNGMQKKSIVEWARYCYSDCHVDTWIDPVMKGGDLSTYQSDIVEVMNLALQCTATDPTARPCARDVLRALEKRSSGTVLHRNILTFC